GPGAGAGSGPDSRRQRLEAAHRPDAAAGRPFSTDHRARSITALRSLLPTSRGPRPALAPTRARRRREHALSAAVRRTATALEPRAGVGWSASPGVPRRADRGHGPARPTQHLGRDSLAP